MYFHIQDQLIDKSSWLFRELLSQPMHNNLHPIQFETSSGVQSIGEIQTMVDWYKQFNWDISNAKALIGINHYSFESDPYVKEQSKKIMSLFSSWDFAMQWELGHNNSKIIDQQYMQLEQN